MPVWWQRQREADELYRWASEVSWQWSEAMEGAALTRQGTSAGRLPLTLIPQVHSVEPGPPVSLLVQMLPGQVVDDFQDQTHRIAAGMGVSHVVITPENHGWITVALVDPDTTSAPQPGPA